MEENDFFVKHPFLVAESVNSKLSKGKINWLLILQAWAMLWVVIGHSCLDKLNCPAWNMQIVTIAYMFHMQLFVMVSGYLFRITRLNKPDQWFYSNTIKEKAIRLGVPGLFFSFVALGLKIAFPEEMNRQVELTWGGVIQSYLYPCDNAFQELWFVVVLFWLFLLMPLWKFIINNNYIIIAFVVLFILGWFHPKTTFLCIDRVCEYSIWFYSGIVLAGIDEEKLNRNTLQRVVLLVIGILLLIVGQLEFFISSFLRTISLILISTGLAFILDHYLPSSFKGFRNYTYQIYLMGIFAQVFVKILYRHFHMPYLLAFVLCVLFGLYVPVLVSKIIERINWKPLLFCVGLKPKK